jgi:hypothetical protein
MTAPFVEPTRYALSMLARTLICLLLSAACTFAADWRKLFDGKTLEGWKPLGDGVWTIMADGTLVGQRHHKLPTFENNSLTLTNYRSWFFNQAWLYTKKDFTEFDLELEYWLPRGGNSGISIRDTSRAAHGISIPADFKRTPSKIGYEIQLNNNYPDDHRTGSIYTFVKAPDGVQRDDQWNRIRIESRASGIRVLLNDKVVAEHPGDPARAKTGPIGLQLHDQASLVMFRNIRIREQ